MIFKIIGGKAVRYDSGGTEKIDDLTVDFSQAESRENISSADNMKTILGKIMKWFSDLSAGAASSLLGQDLTAGKVLVSDDGGKVSASAVDASKVGFLSGVTGDVQTQINSLNSAIRNFALWSKTIPESGMSIADLPEGIYNLSSYGITSLTDLPSGFSSGRSIVITTGTASSSEKVIILASSRSGIIFYGTMYGSALSWKKINFTSL